MSILLREKNEKLLSDKKKRGTIFSYQKKIKINEKTVGIFLSF